MTKLKLLDSVALLEAVKGISMADQEVELPRGQVGRVIEARDPEVVIVQFEDLTATPYAYASVSVTNLLKLRRAAG